MSQSNRRATALETQGVEPATDKPRMDVLDVNTSSTSRGHNTSNTSTTSIYQNTSNTSQHRGGRKDIYINHNIPYVSSHSFSSLAINLRLQLQPHRTVVRGLHASLTNRLLWLYSWLPTITVTLKSRTPFRLYLSPRYRFVTSVFHLFDLMWLGTQ